MQPFSYTGLKVVHDQMVQDAIEQQQFHAESALPGQSLRQAFGSLAARFRHAPTRTQEKSFSACACELN